MVDLLGVPKNLKGYGYLVDAICMCVTNQEYVLNPLKKLYQDVAKNYNDRMENIKTSIERALERAWYLGNSDMFNALFGYSVVDKVKSPSVKKFLFLITKQIIANNRENQQG